MMPLPSPRDILCISQPPAAQLQGTDLGIPLEDALLSHAGTGAVLPPWGRCAKYPEINISAELGDLSK